MIAVSSHRSHNQSDEYARNQTWARKSWVGIFSEVIYLSNHEEALSEPNTFFLGYDGWPTLKEMAHIAAHQNQLTALINADIIVTEPILHVERIIKKIGILGATSYRKEFDPPDYPDLSNAQVKDKGLDIWIAKPEIWSRISTDAPTNLFIGHIQIDTWLCGWMCNHLGYAFRNFNEFGCVYHPFHGGRVQPHNLLEPLKDENAIVAKLPGPL